jgi:hypothetical protein
LVLIYHDEAERLWLARNGGAASAARLWTISHKTERGAKHFALWQNSRKAERGAKQFLISCGCAAAFALY